jgi:hypothetical protein
MLEAHSIFWHYLWVAPNALLLILAFLLWCRGLNQKYPIFFIFAIGGALAQLVIYAADIIPAVTPEIWWRIFWLGLLVEGLLKFALIGEVFAHAFDAYTSVSKLGKFLIRAVGVVLILTAAVAAAFAPRDSRFGIVTGAHLLEQTIYLIESGLLVFIFSFSSYFNVRLKRPVLGIALGLSVSACVHLAILAVVANGGLPDQTRQHLDFLNMGAYHVCVLMWFSYLLVPEKAVAESAVPLPENNLAVWNRELERLLQQ